MVEISSYKRMFVRRCYKNAEILFYDFKKKKCSSKLIFGCINIFGCMFVDESFEIFNCSLSIVLFNFFTIFVDIQCGKPGNLKIRYVHLLKKLILQPTLFCFCWLHITPKGCLISKGILILVPLPMKVPWAENLALM